MTEALATKIGVEAIFYASLAFPAVVATFWPWWRSQLGWSICAKAIALVIATFPAMIFYWVGAHPPAWLVWVSIGGLWAVPLILAWRVEQLFLVQRRGTGQPM